MAIVNQTEHRLRIVVVSVIAVAIILFPRVHDTGFLHIDGWWLLLPECRLAGIIFLLKLLIELWKGEFSPSDKKVLLGNLAITLVFFVLMYFSAPSGISIRKAIIMDYGYEADENYEHAVSIYLLEDLAQLLCGIGFFLIQWKFTLSENTTVYRRSLRTFVIFIAIILSVHFYYTEQHRSTQDIEGIGFTGG